MGTRSAIAIVITVVWAVTYIGSFIQHDYTAFGASTGVMLIVATALLSSDLARHGKRRNGEDRNGRR